MRKYFVRQFGGNKTRDKKDIILGLLKMRIRVCKTILDIDGLQCKLTIKRIKILNIFYLLKTRQKTFIRIHTQLMNLIIKNVFSLPIVFLFKLGVEIWME